MGVLGRLSAFMLPLATLVASLLPLLCSAEDLAFSEACLNSKHSAPASKSIWHLDDARVAGNIMVVDGVLSDAEREHLLGSIPNDVNSRIKSGALFPERQRFSIEAPQLASLISNVLIKSDVDDQEKTLQNVSMPPHAFVPAAAHSACVMQHADVDPTVSNPSAVKGHIALLYLAGSGTLEFTNVETADTQSVDVIPSRLVVWKNQKWLHRVVSTNQNRVFLGPVHSNDRGELKAVGGVSCSGFDCGAGYQLKNPVPGYVGVRNIVSCCDSVATTAAAVGGAGTTAAGGGTTNCTNSAQRPRRFEIAAFLLFLLW